MKAYLERFDKLQLRERRLILIAAVAGVLLVGYSLFIDPAQRNTAAKKTLIATQQAELDTLQTQLVKLREQARQPDAALRRDIAQMKQSTAALETELHQFDHMLVSPEQMPRVLQSMLAKHRGLELVRVKTLPVTPLLQPVADKQAGTAPSQPNQAQPAKQDKPAPPPGGIYRHAVEITLSGSYAELTAYADELQRISPRPLWSGMQLKVVEYPRSELTFTLYTLSLDLPWLAV